MARVELIEPRESDDPELREWAQRLPETDGTGNHFSAEAHFPEVMVPVYEARTAIANDSEIGPTLFTKIAIAISMATDTRHCTGAFCSGLSRRLGAHEDAREFQIAMTHGDIEGKEKDFIDFALKILEDPHAVTDEDFEYLREEYELSDRGFIGLVYAVNIISGYNRVTVGLDLPYDIPYPKEWADPESVEQEVSD